MHISLRPLITRLRKIATLNNGVLIVALLIASTWVWSTIEAIQRNFKLQRQVDALSQEVALQDLQNKTLRLQNTYYNTDQYLELSARELLNVAQPGEKLLLLPPNTIKSAVSDAPNVTATPTIGRSNFSQWMYFLFGKKG